MTASHYRYVSPLSQRSRGVSVRVSGAWQGPAPWIDHGRLALVCEGGGQRGIFTAGVLDSFIEQHFLPFHILIGASAGAQNLTAYACGARGYARHAIMRYTTGKEFIDPLRFARGGHLIDLDWYFDTLHQRAPLDLDHARRRLAQRSFHVCASRRDTLEAAYLPFDVASLRLSVKASSAVPFFYRGGVTYNDVVYWDGGVADALPVRAAHALGADCIVVVRTLPHASGLESAPFSRKLPHKRLQEMASLVQRHLTNHRAAMAFIERPPGSVKVIEIAPERPLLSRMLGSGVEALRQDYRSGQAAGRIFMNNVAWRLRHSSAG